MDQDSPGIDALLGELDQIVQDYRKAVDRVPQEDALRVLEAVDAAATAAERLRRRYSAEAHDQARRAMARARVMLSEARRKDAASHD
jgi:hypothetical protein